MPYILQRLIGRAYQHMGCLVGRSNEPIRSTQTRWLKGYVVNGNQKNLQGYNLEGKGYTS